MQERDRDTEINKFFDNLLEVHSLKNDAALSRAINVAPPIISKARNGFAPITPYFALRLHEHLGVKISDMRKQLPKSALDF